ncbi:MAG: four helix bundle protein [Candidatus Portnoybacteria bacterium]|nr:four helix bundle protein [Candidatus Portnoybacteria bacterium]MDD4982596.1 four helix bundle protein [Candidatus Portnoybacteria bacterium]
MVQKLIAAYKLWHDFLPHIPKTSRYTLGIKIDGLIIETTEIIFIASRLAKNQKMPFVQKAGAKLDLLKFFVQIAWEIKSLDNKKYIALSERLGEIGKMIGGWQKQLLRENPAPGGEKR